METILTDMDEAPNRPITPGLDLELLPGGVICSSHLPNSTILCNIPIDDAVTGNTDPVLY